MKKFIYIIFISFSIICISLCTPTNNDTHDKKLVGDKQVSDSIEQASDFITYKANNKAKTISMNSILAINKQVWDSIGWSDSATDGVKIPFYKMIENKNPLSIESLNQIYGDKYMDSCIWILNNIQDKPSFAPFGYNFGWDFWKGRKSLLTRIDEFPITIICAGWPIDYDHSIFMYYKCVDSDSLVPIDGFIFKWNGMPGFSQEMERNL